MTTEARYRLAPQEAAGHVFRIGGIFAAGHLITELGDAAAAIGRLRDLKDIEKFLNPGGEVHAVPGLRCRSGRSFSPACPGGRWEELE
jgi:hypothetical protein